MRRWTFWIALAVLAPWLAGVTSVAAGHVLPGRLGSLPSIFLTYHIDRVVVALNALIGAATAATAVLRLPLRSHLREIVCVLNFLASLPAYSLAYHGGFKLAQWLGFGWVSS